MEYRNIRPVAPSSPIQVSQLLRAQSRQPHVELQTLQVACGLTETERNREAEVNQGQICHPWNSWNPIVKHSIYLPIVLSRVIHCIQAWTSWSNFVRGRTCENRSGIVDYIIWPRAKYLLCLQLRVCWAQHIFPHPAHDFQAQYKKQTQHPETHLLLDKPSAQKGNII